MKLKFSYVLVTAACLFAGTRFVDAAEPQMIVPLFDSSTRLDPATSEQTGDALITRLADRARGRHAREGRFHAYDEYNSFYWEQRTIGIEIADRVAKGGKDITFRYDTLTPLSAPEFRCFFRGIGTVAEYQHNVAAPLVAPNRYAVTLTHNVMEKRPLQIGDRIEVEISQFIAKPEHGRKNYYGTAFLYVVGRGVVPWEAKGERMDSFPLPETAWLGGLTTLPYQYSDEPKHRFKQMAGNIAPASAQSFMLGRRLHHTDFGNGEHSEKGNPDLTEHAGKLGPAFVAKSCVACHSNNGRALPPKENEPMYQTVIKTGSQLGGALQPQTIRGEPEASASITSWKNIEGQYGDGTKYSLRAPVYAFKGETPQQFSVRLTPQLVGQGLLEAIRESDVLALADPEDANGDGISGRAQVVTDGSGRARLGRFGYRAGQPTVRHQVAGALNSDMGVTTSVFPKAEAPQTSRTTDFQSVAPIDGLEVRRTKSLAQQADGSGDEPELADAALADLTRYISLLGVSARRDLDDDEAKLGEQLFNRIGCAACHAPRFTTSAHHPFAELRGQTIQPFTDLLLHDMGAGLADNLGEHVATGSEWRTSPLWSIGLTLGVSGGEAYLHDGRARSLEEAILWHGGEGEKSKEAFRNLPASDRAALVKFLKSL